MSKPLYFISGKALDKPGGMEQHALAVLQGEWNDLRFIGVASPGSRRHIESRNIQGHTLHHLLVPSLQRSFNRLKRLIAPGSTVFFNEAQLVVLAAKLKTSGVASRILMRSGGNDIAAAWSANIPGKGSLLARLNLRFVSGLMQKHALSPASRLLYRNSIVRLINNCVDVLFVNSDYSFAQLRGLGIRSALMQVARGGVNTDSFRPKTHSKVTAALEVVNHCRLLRFKGLEDAFVAVHRANTRSPQPGFHYTVYGDGPDRDRLQTLIAANGYGSEITLMPGVSAEQVPGILARSDIFLHMPILNARKYGDLSFVQTETMGRSILEAAAAGLPVVTTSAGGVPELFAQGDFGFLVKPHDIETAASHLLDLTDAGLRNHLSNTGRSIVERHFGWSSVFDIYRQVIQS